MKSTPLLVLISLCISFNLGLPVAQAETPGPDNNTPADRAAIAAGSFDQNNCQDRDNNPCLISLNKTYYIHDHSDNGDKLYNFRFIIPENVTQVRFQYKSGKNKPTIDIAYRDDMTEYLPNMQEFSTAIVSFSFPVGRADPDMPGSHNRFGHLIPTDYEITIRDFYGDDNVDCSFSING